MLQIRNRKFFVFMLVIAFMVCYFPVEAAYINADIEPEVSNVLTIIGKLFPELANLSAPSWVKPGLRAYYENFSGTIVENVASFGAINTYPLLRSTSLRNPVEVIIQNDIVVANSDISWTKSTSFSSFSQVPLGEFLYKGASSVGSFWINPQVLKESYSSALSNFTVTRLNYTTNRVTYSAYRIDYKENLPDSTHYTWVIDSETGLLLYVLSRARNSSSLQTQVNVSAYISSTQRNISTSYFLPRWASVGNVTRYVGTTKTVQFNGTISQNPIALTATISSMGTNWTEFKISQQLYDQVQPVVSTVVMGPGFMVGGFWMPTTTLTRLRTGDVIDPYDSVNGVTTEVSFVGYRFGNTAVVTIVKNHKLYKSSWTYRISDGMLIHWTEEKIINIVNGITQINEYVLEGI